MPSIAATRTAEILATLPEPAEQQPRAAGDFGRDVLCIDTLRTGRYMSGTLLVAANLYHRIKTPPGALRGSPEDLDFGLGVQRFIGKKGMSAIDIAAAVEAECRKDAQRVQSVTVQAVEHRSSAGDVEVDLDVRAQTTAGPVRFKVTADAVSARFLGFDS